MGPTPRHSTRYHRVNGIVFIVALLVGLVGLITPLLGVPVPVAITSTAGIVGILVAYAAGRNFMCEGSCNAA